MSGVNIFISPLLSFSCGGDVGDGSVGGVFLFFPFIRFYWIREKEGGGEKNIDGGTLWQNGGWTKRQKNRKAVGQQKQNKTLYTVKQSLN